MGDFTVKIPPEFQWPPANSDVKPESAFQVASSWSGLPMLNEGTDYRLVDKTTTIPTIEILAAPASKAFWQLQAAVLDGKIRLGHTPFPETLPLEPFDIWESLHAVGSRLSGLLVGAYFAIEPALGIRASKWVVTGDGPWQYAKEESYNSSHWIQQVGFDPVVGPLITVDGTFTGKPCGHLTLNASVSSTRIALASSASDLNFIYRANNPDQRIQYDTSTGQYYLESISGAAITDVDVDVYRKHDVQLCSDLPAPHFSNNESMTVRADQLSLFTRRIFDAARQLALPEEKQLQWAAQKLAESGQYERSPAWVMLRISVAPESTYLQLHQPDGIRKYHCEIAATEFFHAAKAYGYNVRFVSGFMNAQDTDAHAWVEFGDADGVHVLEATPHGFESASNTKSAETVEYQVKKNVEPDAVEQIEWIKYSREIQRVLGGKNVTLESIQPILQTIPNRKPIIPQRSSVPEELRVLFNDLTHYINHPNREIALNPVEALKVAGVRWGLIPYNDFLHQPSFNQGRALFKTMTEGLPQPVWGRPEHEDYTNAPLYHLLAFFYAARAYGYPVTLSVGLNVDLIQMSVGVRNNAEYIPVLVGTQYPSRTATNFTSNALMDSSGIYQRMTWIDQQNTGVNAFLGAMQMVSSQSDADAFAVFSKPVSAIPPIMRAYHTSLPWDVESRAGQGLDAASLSSQYTVPAPPQEPPPLTHLSGWRKASTRPSVLYSHYEFQGRPYLVHVERIFGENYGVIQAPFESAARKNITPEDLVGVPFQRVDFDPGDGTIYYSPDLDLAVSSHFMERTVMRNSQGQLVGFQWQFPVRVSTSGFNRLLPILRSDLSDQNDNGISDGRYHAIAVNNHEAESYHVLTPLFNRLLIEARKDGGLRSPQTDSEKAHVVMLYQKMMQMGVVRDVDCMKGAKHCKADIQETVAMMYVMVEYQKLWEQNKGVIPETLMASDCARVTRDNIPTGETACFPQMAQVPDSGLHREWMHQLARQLRSYEVDPNDWPADIQNVMKGARQW